MALIIAAAAMLSLPVAIRHFLDRILATGDSSIIDRYFLLLFSLAVIYGVFAALRFYLVSWLGERVAADVREAVFSRVLSLDSNFFERTQVGEILSRLSTDTTIIQSISGVGMSIALRSALTLVGGLIMLVFTSPGLAAWVIVTVPLVLIPILLIGRRVRTLSRSSQDRVAESSGLAGEVLSAISTVQAYTLEQLHADRFAKSVRTAFATSVLRIKMRSLLTAVAIVTLFGAMTLIVWIGAHRVLREEMTVGELGQFLLYAFFVGGAAAALSEVWGEVQRAAGAMERLSELLKEKPGITSPASSVSIPPMTSGHIDFKNVAFHYQSRPDSRAIDGLTLTVRAGETVAVVGPSGAGKSTLFQLLLRFHDPQSGQILLDGVDISQFNLQQLRRYIGLVPQETVIFSASVRENIAYGRPGANADSIEEAARSAGAHEFISRLPDGYATQLGERGVRLSGGQRQSLAIARVVLKDPSILLLDEATSSLDAESERTVQRGLDRLMQNRTTLVIAHRLSTVRKVDRIVVVDQGVIQDIGSHEQLVDRNPLYAHLAALQFLDSE